MSAHDPVRTRKQLGLIGFGSFGRFAARHLREHFDVIATDTVDGAAAAERIGVRWGTLDDAATCPFVVLCVPVQQVAIAAEALGSRVRPGALVLDTCSVKLAPVADLVRLLPETVEIVGTHPMFGPQSAAAGLAGHRIVVCPVRTTRLEHVESFLRELGLDVFVADAEQHDRDIAHTQALAQFVGRALAELGESDTPIRTPGYRQFHEVAETVGQDSWQLFCAIQNLNPFAAEMRAELLARLHDLQTRLAAESDD